MTTQMSTALASASKEAAKGDARRHKITITPAQIEEMLARREAMAKLLAEKMKSNDTAEIAALRLGYFANQMYYQHRLDALLSSTGKHAVLKKSAEKTAAPIREALADIEDKLGQIETTNIGDLEALAKQLDPVQAAIDFFDDVDKADLKRPSDVKTLIDSMLEKGILIERSESSMIEEGFFSKGSEELLDNGKMPWFSWGKVYFIPPMDFAAYCDLVSYVRDRIQRFRDEQDAEVANWVLSDDQIASYAETATGSFYEFVFHGKGSQYFLPVRDANNKERKVGELLILRDEKKGFRVRYATNGKVARAFFYDRETGGWFEYRQFRIMKDVKHPRLKFCLFDQLRREREAKERRDAKEKASVVSEATAPTPPSTQETVNPDELAGVEATVKSLQQAFDDSKQEREASESDSDAKAPATGEAEAPAAS